MNDVHPEKPECDHDELNEAGDSSDTAEHEAVEGERHGVGRGSQKKREDLERELSAEKPPVGGHPEKPEKDLGSEPKKVEKKGILKGIFNWFKDKFASLKKKFSSWMPSFWSGEKFEKLKHYEKSELLNPSAPSFTFLKGSAIRMSSDYGMRTHPVDHTEKMHKGIDLAAKDGTPIIATEGGRVDGVGVGTSAGNWIAIVFENGDRLSFSHLLHPPAARKGQPIQAGDLIGLVGSTGKSTGNHVHVELKINGEHQDPTKYKKVD